MIWDIVVLFIALSAVFTFVGLIRERWVMMRDPDFDRAAWKRAGKAARREAWGRVLHR